MPVLKPNQCLVHEHNLSTSKLVNVSYLATALTSTAFCILRAAFFFSQQDGQDFDGWIETEGVCAAPAGEAWDADAGTELRGEVEVPQDLFVEGQGLLVD
jgi:hypothetical protein